MNKVIAIVGPTASGKTELSVKIAEHFNTEIISADSRQVYRNIPIVSSVPTLDERKGIKHYFLEILNLDEEFNAGIFAKETRKIINRLFRKSKIPIIVGGSGLYVKALIDGLFEIDIESKEIREELNNILIEKGKEYLYDRLKKIDPESANKITPSFYRRVIRALEVFYCSGVPISKLQKENISVPHFNSIQFGISMVREKLYERINKRVDKMLECGLIDEIRNLLRKGYHYKTHNSLNTVGIKEVVRYLENEFDYNTMTEEIKKNTRRFAKRQLTWFRKDKRIIWVDASENIYNDIIKILEK